MSPRKKNPPAAKAPRSASTKTRSKVKPAAPAPASAAPVAAVAGVESPPTERRRYPRLEPPAPLPMAQLDDYAPIVGRQEIDQLRFLADRLRGRRVKMVNSTAVGGGVAEILNRLIPLMNELEIQHRWEVITGGQDFFEVTKAFHNALHGAPYDLTGDAQEIFLRYNEQNRQRMAFGEDVVVIHDPQPAGLIHSRQPDHGKWVWRCHIDLSNPHPGVWGLLRPLVEEYDTAIFSSPAFSRRLSIPQYLFYPCIDPLSEKNKKLEESSVQDVCDAFGIDRSRPILTQVSRFDRLKDPVGVIRAYKMVKRYVDCQLVLAGGGASDDPEGAAVLAEAQTEAAGDPDVFILDLPPWSAFEINALQSASTIIIQKSLREGFGLTVAEGLWKGKPVIAGAVGGIPVQVIHKLTGMLVHSVEGCAFQIRYLLTHPEFAAQLGRNGREHVRENFLMTSNVKRYLLLYLQLLGAAAPELA